MIDCALCQQRCANIVCARLYFQCLIPATNDYLFFTLIYLIVLNNFILNIPTIYMPERDRNYTFDNKMRKKWNNVSVVIENPIREGYHERIR